MYQFSDSDSSDSEDGIRFKTDSTRDKSTNRRIKHSPDKRRQRSHSPSSRKRHSKKHKKSSRRSNSRERETRRDQRSQSRERKRHKQSKERDDFKNSHRKRSKSKDKHDSTNKRKKEVKVSGEYLSEKEFSRKDKLVMEYEGKCNSEEPYTEPPHVLKESEDKGLDNIKRDVPVLTSNIETTKTDQEDTDQASSQIGPALPPHLSMKCDDTSNSTIDSASSSNDLTVGHSLPSHMNKQNKETNDCDDSKQDNEVHNIGPALPPHMLPKNETQIGPALPPHLNQNYIGPALPPHLLKVGDDPQNIVEPLLPSSSEESQASIGPIIPPHLRKELEENAVKTIAENIDEDDAYGPLPPDIIGTSKAHIALEERALQMKIDKLKGPEVVKEGREEWMLELPTVHASNLGLGPRQFRAKERPDMSDRSSWTDTPEDKANKKHTTPIVDLKKEAELREIQTRDKEQEEMSKKHKKRKNKSLLEEHQEKLKAKKNEDANGSIRRPFSRETDLQVNRFDDAQKKAILKKAQLLDDRFSKGQSKYL